MPVKGNGQPSLSARKAFPLPRAGWLKALRQWHAARMEASQVSAWLFPAPWAWGLLAVMMALTLLFLTFSPMRVKLGGNEMYLAIALVLLLVLAAYTAYRGVRTLALFQFALAHAAISGVTIQLLNYLSTGWGFPYRDAELARLQELVGLDWKGYVFWVNEHPLVARILELAYMSHEWLIPFTFIGLVALGMATRLREFLLLSFITALACVFISGLLPAQGAYTHYGLSPASLRNIPDAATIYLHDLQHVHAGTLKQFELAHAKGLATFPSFHTVMALLFAWAWRGTWLQWPVWILAALIIISTPVIGSHFFMDIVGGVAVFWLCLKLLDAVGESDPSARGGLLRLPRWPGRRVLEPAE